MHLFHFLRPLVFAVSSLAGVLLAADAPSYVLKPNDVVRLAVFNEAALSSQTRLLQSGEAMFPLIGAVKISGLSIGDATEKVRALYDADYLVDPRLTLSVDEYALQQISVLGSVKAPGEIPIPNSGHLDMAAALAAAGGLSETADPARISLVRAGGGSGQFSLADIERGSKVPLAPGDRIIVAESRYVNQTVTFVGQVRAPGSVPFPMDGDLDIVTAVARVGGFSELASPKKTSINRKGRVIIVDVKEMTAKGGTRFKLEPDDIITVPERLF
ncbi:polysaccharide biosynthesis/export family protein [bacterium]|nr:polysaccharide biosynthesis/export family protein [bacterium]